VSASRGDAALAEALSRYREALLRGAPADELARLAAPLDPELVATARWSLTAGRQSRPQPDARFVRDLRRELVQSVSGTSVTPPTLRVVPPVSLDDRRAERPPASTDVPDEPRGALVFPRKWAWGQVAAAAVLAVMLVGSLLLVRFVTFERPETQLGASGEPTTQTLVDATIVNDAETWTPLAVEWWRFQPGGSTLSIPPLDGPQWIVADGGPLVATVDGEGQALAPGASLVVPAGQELEIRNAGLTEAAMYRGVAAAGFALEEYDRNLVTQDVGLDTEAHESLPPGESHIVFDRLSIPPGTTMKAEAATGRDWFDVVTGTLGVTLIGDDLPTGWQSGQEQELTPDDSIPVLVPGTSVSMRNVDDDPLLILRLRVTPVTAEES
jgi:hypothetical protein